MDTRGCGFHYFFFTIWIGSTCVITIKLVAKMGFIVALAWHANIKEDYKHS